MSGRERNSEQNGNGSEPNFLFSPSGFCDSSFVYSPCLIALFFLSSGAVCDRFFLTWQWQTWLNLGVLGAIAWLGFTLFTLRQTSRQLNSVVNKTSNNVFGMMAFQSALICTVLFALGGVWHNCYWNVCSQADMLSRCQTSPCPCIVRGVITDLPHRTRAEQGFSPIPEYDKTVFTVQMNSVRSGRSWEPAAGSMRVSVTGHPSDLEVGDDIELIGVCSRPHSSPNGRFNYQEYLRSRKILTVMNVRNPDGVKRCSEIIRRASFQRWFSGCQRQALQGLDKRFSIKREARLASAFLLGKRTDLPEGVAEEFQETGTIHILIVSGLHVGILTMTLQYIFSFLPLGVRFRSILICVLILFYIALTGMQPPAVRAGVLCLTASYAAAFNRRALSFNVLALSGIIVLILYPSSLFQTGTQLSFLTVGAIIALAPTAEKIANRVFPVDKEIVIRSGERWRRKLRIFFHNVIAAAAMSFLILGVIAPLIATRFHVLSLFSVLLNLVLSVPIVVAILTGMVVMFLTPFDSFFLFDFIANGCAVVCQSSLWLMDFTVETVHSWRWSRFWVCGLNEPSLIAFYVILFSWAFIRICRVRSLLTASVLACWLAFISLTPMYNALMRPEQMNVEFINVEHGLCTLIRLPDGKILLYDAGKMTNPQRGVESVCDYLWSQGITKIHGAILSHSDADHYNMFPTLSERFAIDTVYTSESMFDDADNETLDRFKRYLERANVNVHIVYRGDKLGNSKQYKIEFLHPGPGGVLDLISPENANSLVVELEYAGKRVLLTGDLVGNGVREVTMEESPGYDVVQAPHHGSHLSLTPEFIQWMNASYAVFSESPVYAHKDSRRMFEQAGVKVIHTGLDGSAQFAIFPNGELKTNIVAL
ncbi:MAG: ComEC/Rec2 family competence protein [Thermoguttaceae bacterium]|nr:ComEC/Rec2 family competence protein [Thermoguttaceae bacterium]